MIKVYSFNKAPVRRQNYDTYIVSEDDAPLPDLILPVDVCYATATNKIQRVSKKFSLCHTSTDIHTFWQTYTTSKYERYFGPGSVRNSCNSWPLNARLTDKLACFG